MSRNVTIVVIILILVVIAGYLVWLRGQYQPPQAPSVQVEQSTPTPSVSPVPEATKSATPSSTQKGTKVSTPSAR